MIVQELRDVFVYARIKVWKAHERQICCWCGILTSVWDIQLMADLPSAPSLRYMSHLILSKMAHMHHPHTGWMTPTAEYRTALVWLRVLLLNGIQHRSTFDYPHEYKGAIQCLCGMMFVRIHETATPILVWVPGTRPDPYPHIGCTSGKPLNNIGGMMLYHPESRLIIMYNIYICMNIHINMIIHISYDHSIWYTLW